MRVLVNRCSMCGDFLSRLYEALGKAGIDRVSRVDSADAMLCLYTSAGQTALFQQRVGRALGDVRFKNRVLAVSLVVRPLGGDAYEVVNGPSENIPWVFVKLELVIEADVEKIVARLRGMASNGHAH